MASNTKRVFLLVADLLVVHLCHHAWSVERALSEPWITARPSAAGRTPATRAGPTTTWARCAGCGRRRRSGSRTGRRWWSGSRAIRW
ncbi:hypothetical protein VTK73DRAFT_3854 [Phialemonium thermophilum]|uniref:Secreted protein n=1 Tax=Phialemonium thermophilum TaxID=223376 RepID=A0ABR3WWK9_9PEZI